MPSDHSLHEQKNNIGALNVFLVFVLNCSINDFKWSSGALSMTSTSILDTLFWFITSTWSCKKELSILLRILNCSQTLDVIWNVLFLWIKLYVSKRNTNIIILCGIIRNGFGTFIVLRRKKIINWLIKNVLKSWLCSRSR